LAKDTLEALVERALGGTYPSAHEAVQAISRLNGPESLEGMAKLAAIGDEATRADVADSLAAVAWEAPEIDGLLARLVEDKSPRVRTCAIECVAARHATGLLSKLVDAFHADAAWLVRATAAEALGDLGSAETVAELASGLRDESEVVQAYAALSIGLLGTRDHLDLLRARLEAASPRVLPDLLGAMYRLGNAESLLPLIQSAVVDESSAVVLMNVLQDLVNRRRPPSLDRDKEDFLAAADALAGQYPAVRFRAERIREILGGSPRA
jgi:HEAT repeat protein